MKRIKTQNGVVISYDTYGSGPPLVLVHGGFSDHDTNWQEVKPLLKDRFSVYAVARRGRGDSSATHGRSVESEAHGDNHRQMASLRERACVAYR